MLLTIAKKRTRLVRARSIQAFGNGRLETVSCMTGRGEKKFQAKSLLVHNGFIPRTHFSRLLRCEHAWDALGKCWYPSCTSTGASLSYPNIYFSGDGQMAHGADAALLKGRLAGLDAARALGALSAEEAAQKSAAPRRALSRLLFARAYVNAMFSPNLAYAGIPDETILCRCEHITAGQVRGAVKEGCLDINDIKTRTRAGMGPCQARMCAESIAGVMAAAMGALPEQAGMLSVRPPVRPISMLEYCEYER